MKIETPCVMGNKSGRALSSHAVFEQKGGGFS